MVRENFRISELVERTGVPAPTIHHYLRLGMLPPPVRVARNRFLYDDGHVQALRLIQTLRRRRRLPLPVIRRILPDLLGLRGEEGFRPEMWDRALDLRARRSTREPATRLMVAAIEAFSRRGYADVNVDDICRAARIAKGSFYRHHRSKEDLFFAVADVAGREVAAAFAAAMPDDPVATHDELATRAAGILARAIEPRIAIFLDLFARTVERRAGYRSAAQRVFGDLVHAVGARVDAGHASAAGIDALHRSFGILLADVVSPWPATVPALSVPGTRTARSSTR
jgi:AcrR family transcriptional regulator